VSPDVNRLSTYLSPIPDMMPPVLHTSTMRPVAVRDFANLLWSLRHQESRSDEPRSSGISRHVSTLESVALIFSRNLLSRFRYMQILQSRKPRYPELRWLSFLCAHDLNPAQLPKDLTAIGTSSTFPMDPSRQLLLLEGFPRNGQVLLRRPGFQACAWDFHSHSHWRESFVLTFDKATKVLSLSSLSSFYKSLWRLVVRTPCGRSSNTIKCWSFLDSMRSPTTAVLIPFS